MPARVEFRLGSIFDEPADLLVIPLSAEGTVSSDVEPEIRKGGIPLPPAITRGISQVMVHDARWKTVVYAAPESGQTWSSVTVEELGQEVGRLATSKKYASVSAPLLLAHGTLAPDVAAAALMRGFMTTAPEETLLVISLRNPGRLAALVRMFPHAVARHIQHQPDAAAEAPRGPAEGFLQRLERLASVTGPRAPASRVHRKGVFISYSHADAEWLDRLQKHLKPLQREGVEVWDDTRLKAGEQWREEIRDALAAAKVAILLISADFLASDFIVTNELPPLLKAAEEGGATILPVIISPCRFTRMESLSRFQAVNDPAKPLVQMRRAGRETVLDRVARAVEDALNR